MYSEESQIGDRIIASLSYLTGGLVGFVWLVIAFLTKKNLRGFLHYHVFQAIFLSILYYIVSALLGLVMQILSVLPFVGQISGRIFFMLNMPLFYGFSLINTLIYAVIFYLALTSLLGKYSYLPWVSNIIAGNLKR